MSWVGPTIISSLVVVACIAWYYAIIVLGREYTTHDVAVFGESADPILSGIEITSHELGEIEENIEGLTEVVVVAHRVQEPGGRPSSGRRRI